MGALSELIATESLVKFFGNITALQELDLRIPKGISGFIGPNGAGKTTTINILLGLLKPDQGKARVFGFDSWHESFRIRQKVGVLHERPSYPGAFTGQRYLEHVAAIYGVCQSPTKVQEILKTVGLSDARDRAIKTYSAGMIQRLGLAQALVGEPELAILDEPTANLDPLGRIEFLEKIKELHQKEGTDFFVSSHILPELERICDWVSIVNHGIVVAQGRTEDLTAEYSASIFKIEASDNDLLASQLKETGLVEKAWTEAGTLYCKVRNAKDLQSGLPKLLTELRLELRSFQPMTNNLEEIFKSVIGRDKE